MEWKIKHNNCCAGFSSPMSKIVCFLGLHSTNNNDHGFIFILCNLSIKAQAFSQTLLFSTDPKNSLGYSKNKKHIFGWKWYSNCGIYFNFPFHNNKPNQPPRYNSGRAAMTPKFTVGLSSLIHPKRLVRASPVVCCRTAGGTTTPM